MRGDGYGGFTNPITKEVTIDNDNLKDGRTPKQIDQLENTIIHESIHRTQPRSDMFKRPLSHDDIYKEADKRQKNPKLPSQDSSNPEDQKILDMFCRLNPNSEICKNRKCK